MKVDEFQIFTTKAEDVYSRMQADVDSWMVQITKVEYSATEIDEISQRIFSNLFKFETADFGKEEKNIVSEELNIDLGSALIGNGFTFSHSSSTSLITQLSYFYPSFKGQRGLSVSVKYPRRSLRGRLVQNYLQLDFYIQGNNIAEHGPGVKRQKDQLMTLIEDNNRDLKEYFESRRGAFLEYIKHKIEEKVSSNKQRQSDLNSF